MNEASKHILQRELDRLQKFKENTVEQKKFTQEAIDKLNDDINKADARIAELGADLNKVETFEVKKRVLPPDGTPGLFIGYEAGGAGVWLIKWIPGFGWSGNGQRRCNKHQSGFRGEAVNAEPLAAFIIQCDRVLD